MRARLLRPDEWSRIKETELDYATWFALDPASAQIVIVEDDAGAIVACWGTFAVRHVEGFWIRPDHRKKGSVLRRLAAGMHELLRALGATSVLTQSESAEVTTLLRSAGATRLKGVSFQLPADLGLFRAKR